MNVYINYPNSHIAIHSNKLCSEIGKQNKPGQRVLSVTNHTLISTLSQFISKTYSFSSTASENDMWIDVNLSSHQHEIGFVFMIQGILGTQYKPFATAPIIFHC